MSEYKLTQGIIQLSNSDMWDTAKLEWSLLYIYEAEEPETCLCSHSPIIEVCVLKNKYNHNTTIVGNSCVKKFIGLPSDKFFIAVKRVKKDITKSFNAETINYAYTRGWLKDNEFKFLVDTIRKRSLSEKQINWRKKLNNKVLLNIQYSRTN